MTMGMRRLAVVAGVLLLAAGVADHAFGFFPKGGFNLNQQLRYAIWPFREFDTNNNGVIEKGEGLEFRIEGGPRGFSTYEMDQVKAGFDTWQKVPTSYAAFRFAGIIEDPILPGASAPDYLPTVFMQVNEVAPDDGYSQPDEAIVAELTNVLPAVTLVLYTIDITALPVAGNTVIVSAGTILDCDIIVNASLHRSGVMPNTTFGVLDLQATIVNQVGNLLGLSPTPLNNLDPYNSVALEGAEQGLPVEPVVMQLTGTDGIARMIGATPTMFPIYFVTEDTSGNYVAGWRDLAPDDISGVSWLYPREDGLENFFSIQHEARTHVREATGIPPAPISGAHIVAWANVSGSESARRIPLFSTMSGLYEKYTNTQLTGWFMLMGLWKQLETPGKVGSLFTPSYVLTMNPINGLGFDRQAPPDFTPGQFDSIQGALPTSYSTITRSETEFTSNYPSEVFNEDGNIYGIDNNPAGTPLVWSYIKNTVVSKNSDKILAKMLPRNKPMFGDADKVCPMNVIENAEGALPTENVTISGINNQLRGVRDNVFLRSATGTALVDIYYRSAPYLSEQLTRHPALLKLIRKIIASDAWGWKYAPVFIAMLLLGMGAGIRRLVRTRFRSAYATIALLLVVMAVASVAWAGQLPITTEDMVAEATYIVSGKVISSEGRYGSDNRIYSDVVFRVDDVAKGALNKGSNITFSIIGGRYGSMVLTATGIPCFETDEHALLYLREVEGYGLVPYGGYRSKVPIYIDPETEEEEVDAPAEGEKPPAEGEKPEGEAEGEMVEGEAEGENAEGENEGEVTKVDKRPPPAKSTASVNTVSITAPTGRVALSEYMNYLRAIARRKR